VPVHKQKAILDMITMINNSVDNEFIINKPSLSLASPPGIDSSGPLETADSVGEIDVAEGIEFTGVMEGRTVSAAG